MTTYKYFELKIKGTVVILGFTFIEADRRFAKAMKAITRNWDIDTYCKELDPQNAQQKEFPLNISGRIVIEGNSYEEAKTLFETAINSVSDKWTVEVTQGETSITYDPPRRLRRGDTL
jgi:hypothetical protein